MTKWSIQSETDSGFIQVLTSDIDGAVLGYRLAGKKPGPQVVVAGACQIAEPVFQRLMAIPTLPWMRGSLVLIRLDVLDRMISDASKITPLGNIDRTVVLPWVDPLSTPEDVLKHSYHMVLRVCAGLGMIAGRGVQPDAVRPAA